MGRLCKKLPEKFSIIIFNGRRKNDPNKCANIMEWESAYYLWNYHRPDGTISEFWSKEKLIAQYSEGKIKLIDGSV